MGRRGHPHCTSEAGTQLESGGLRSDPRIYVLSALMVHHYPLKTATQRALSVAQVNLFSTSRNTIVVIVSMLLSLSLNNFMHREEEIEPFIDSG